MAAPPFSSSADPGPSEGSGESARDPEASPSSAPAPDPTTTDAVTEVLVGDPESAPLAEADPPAADPGAASSGTVETAPVAAIIDASPATRRTKPSFIARVGGGLKRGIGGAADGLTRFAEAGLGFLWPYLLASVGLGSAIWFGKHRDHLPELLTNKVAWELQIQIARNVAASFAGLVALLALALVVVRIKTERFQFARTTARLGAFATSLVAAPFAVGLFVPSLEASHAILTLVFCGLISLIVAVSVYRGLGGDSPFAHADGSERSPPVEGRAGKWAAVVALVLLWAGYGLYFSHLAITNHHGLATRTTDLGYYDNIFYQSIHGRFLGCSFIKAGYHGSAHFDPILILLSPLYLLYPRAEMILTLQSFWLGSAVVPIYLIGRHWSLSRLMSVVVAACFVLHPAVHGANMYEFHSLTLASVPILWAFYLLESNRLKAFFPVLLIALLTREDISLIMCFVGMSVMMRFTDRRRVAGFVTILMSLVYFGITKAFFMTSAGIFMSGPEAYSYAYYYEELTPNNKGFGGFLMSLMTNPVFVVNHVLEEAKLVYILTLFLPLLFLPFLAKKGKFMMSYGLFFTLMATRTAVFSTHFQYSSTLLPLGFALVPAAIARVKESGTLKNLGFATARLAPALVTAMFVSTVFVTIKFGGILDNQSFRGGFSRVVRVLTPQDKENYEWIKRMVAQIPESAAVAATDKMGPHISGRKNAFFYGDTKPVDYVFVDEHEIRADRLTVLQNDVRRGALVELGRKGSLALFKTSEPKAAAQLPAAPAKPTPPLPVLGPQAPGRRAPAPVAPTTDPRAAEDDRLREPP